VKSRGQSRQGWKKNRGQKKDRSWRASEREKKIGEVILIWREEGSGAGFTNRRNAGNGDLRGPMRRLKEGRRAFYRSKIPSCSKKKKNNERKGQKTLKENTEEIATRGNSLDRERRQAHPNSMKKKQREETENSRQKYPFTSEQTTSAGDYISKRNDCKVARR